MTTTAASKTNLLILTRGLVVTNFWQLKQRVGLGISTSTLTLYGPVQFKEDMCLGKPSRKDIRNSPWGIIGQMATTCIPNSSPRAPSSLNQRTGYTLDTNYPIDP